MVAGVEVNETIEREKLVKRESRRKTKPKNLLLKLNLKFKNSTTHEEISC